jgi:predicted unusual protein kinase regulating ubiquinone biosynthesis (AarF/ABC1/UbiB family)
MVAAHMRDDDPKVLKTSRLGRLASMVRAGVGTATSMMVGSSAGFEQVVDRLGELRGLGTKVGQMAGLVEASLPPDVREKIGPVLVRLRAQAARSRYEDIARLIEEDLGAPPEKIFARFDREAFASASLGQVHDAEHHDGRHLAVKVQHPGIREAFENDLSNVTSLGRIAAAFVMPSRSGGEFIAKVKEGFLAELDYRREADNLRTFARLTAGDPDLELPTFLPDTSSARVLTATFLQGTSVEVARNYPNDTRRRQAASIRRFVLSALADHGVLYADAHAGNFLFREDGTVGVLDFGSVFHLDDEHRLAFGQFRDALAASDRKAFGDAVRRVFGIDNEKAVEAIANVQFFAIGGLVRGESIGGDRVRAITTGAAEMKAKLLGQRFTISPFLPFFMRTMLALNALLAGLDAPESGPLGRLRSEGCKTLP